MIQHPSSKDPSTGSKIDPTADNLTFSNIYDEC